jgi:hypothetical protein
MSRAPKGVNPPAPARVETCHPVPIPAESPPGTVKIARAAQPGFRQENRCGLAKLAGLGIPPWRPPIATEIIQEMWMSAGPSNPHESTGSRRHRPLGPRAMAVVRVALVAGSRNSIWERASGLGVPPKAKDRRGGTRVGSAEKVSPDTGLASAGGARHAVHAAKPRTGCPHY